jgi:hypothetical protein
VTALRELLQRYSEEEHPGKSETVDPKTGKFHLMLPVVASSGPKP